MERWENIHQKWQKFLKLECLFTFCVHAAYIRIESSQDWLAHTLARLPDTRKQTSDFISPILARYDLKKKKKKFRMTVEPSYRREGGRFQMTDEPWHWREKVNS